MNIFKKLILSNILLFVAIALFAAEAPDVSVTVKDSKTKEAIGYATIELLTVQDSVLTGGITNDKGFLSLPCNVDSAKIRIQYLGYKTYQATVANKNIGTVLMEEDAQLLKEVTVTGSARTTKVDRDVYVISKEMKAGTSLSRELLGKLNGVFYNPLDQSLSVNGNQNILILINGIEKSQDMAKTMSPDRIDRVEIIKDPVGKYAADGYKTVINIITKKDYAGIDANAYFNSAGNFSKYNLNPSPYFRNDNGVNINYTYNKINLYTGYWNGDWRPHLPSENSKQYGDLIVATAPIDNNKWNLFMQGGATSVWAGGDYMLKPNNTLSLELNYNCNENKNIQNYELTTYLDGIPIGKSQSTSSNRSTNDAWKATLTYRGKWNKKSNFEANFRYQYSTPTNYSSFVQDAMQNDSYNKQNENFYRLNLDYNYQFTDKFSMDVAYGTIIDNYQLYQDNQTLTQNQIRNRPSLYLSYAPFQKLSMKVGSTVEFFHQTYQGENQDLSQMRTAFLPFINIKYNPINKFSVTAKYHSWPTYPAIGQLSPFTAQMDTLTWSVGNPDLGMSNYQEASLEFNILQRFTIEPFYAFDHSNIQQYIWEDADKYYQGSVNADKFEIYGLRVNFMYPLTKALFWQNSLNLEDMHISYKEADTKRTRFYLNSVLMYNLPKWNASAGVGLQKMRTQNPTLLGYNPYGDDVLFLMIQKSFFKNRLNCSLLYALPVNFFKYSEDSYAKATNYEAFTHNGTSLLKNFMMLRLNYHFSTGKQVKIKKSSLDNESSAPSQKGSGLLSN